MSVSSKYYYPGYNNYVQSTVREIIVLADTYDKVEFQILEMCEKVHFRNRRDGAYRR